MMQRFSNKYLDLQINISSYPLSLLIFSPSQSLLILARSLTKIGQASMNQALMVVATKCGVEMAEEDTGSGGSRDGAEQEEKEKGGREQP
ncbi:hypothetical protein DY000_02006494 [Brassica cretica]|uniref:Uncharacterized protein n=1 Tax=Brassica cretica TaxID=69181 RepID=A0ABQ7C4X6_BRACR|nr:hypothetical protein DY000_02006494 [Brassica cretica]